MEAKAGCQAMPITRARETATRENQWVASSEDRQAMGRGVLFITFLALISSVTITFLALATTGVGNPRIGMVMASICCLLIAPPISYYHLRLAQQLKAREHMLEELNRELQVALSEVRELSGMLPICSSCKKIRDDAGYWQQIEDYIGEHSRADFTHSLCPDCAARILSRLPKNRS